MGNLCIHCLENRKDINFDKIKYLFEMIYPRKILAVMSEPVNPHYAY